VDKPDCDLSSQYDNGVGLFKLQSSKMMAPGDWVVMARVALAIAAGVAYAFVGEQADWPRASFFWFAAALEISTIFFK